MKKNFFETSGVQITRDNINPFDFRKSTPIPKIISPKVSNVINRISDVEGLDKAYKSNANIYFAPGGDTLYISGTKHVDSIIKNQLRAPGYASLLQNLFNNDFQDVFDDLKIPLHLTRYTQRYNEADQALKANPLITKIIGHSLGGSVSLELEKNNSDRTFEVRTYGAPVWSSEKSNNRYRASWDPISMFDKGANTVNGTSFNPHAYDNGFNNDGTNFEERNNENKVGITE